MIKDSLDKAEILAVAKALSDFSVAVIEDFFDNDSIVYEEQYSYVLEEDDIVFSLAQVLHFGYTTYEGLTDKAFTALLNVYDNLVAFGWIDDTAQVIA
jgi:hypothetical protein